MWVYDRATLKILEVNHEAIKHYGYSEIEFKLLTLEDLKAKEDLQELYSNLAYSKKPEESYRQVNARHVKKDGTLINVQLRGSFIEYQGYDAELITAIDLTELYTKEKQIVIQKTYLEIISAVNRHFLENSDWRVALQLSLETMLSKLQFERIWFTKFNENNGKPVIELSSNTEIDNSTNSLNNELCSILHQQEEIEDKLYKGKIVEFNSKTLHNSDLSKKFHEQGISSLLIYPIPIPNQDEYLGCITLIDQDTNRVFIDEDFNLLEVLSNNLVNAIEKEKIQLHLVKSERKFRALIQEESNLVLVSDVTGTLKYASPVSKQLLGIPQDDMRSINIFDQVHPDDIQLVYEQLVLLKEQKQLILPTVRVYDIFGKIHYLKTTVTNLLKDTAINGFVANATDITEEILQQQEDQLMLSLTKTIGNPGSIITNFKKGLAILQQYTGAVLGEFWVKSFDKDTLDLFAANATTKNATYFESEVKDIKSFPIGTGLPGKIATCHCSLLWENLETHPEFIRHEAAGKSGLNMALGIPIKYNNEFLGTIVLFFEKQHPLQAEQRKILDELGKQLGSVIKQKLQEEEFTNFFNMSPSVQCIIDTDGNILKSNYICFKILGIDTATTIGQNIINYMFGNDQLVFKKHLKAVQQTDERIRFESRLGSGSDSRWILWSMITQHNKNVVYIVGKDITEQKHIDTELQYTIMRLKKAQQLAQLGYWRHYIKEEVIEWSEETYEIYGYRPDNFTPTLERVRQHFHPDDRHLIKQNPSEIFKPGRIQSLEHRITTADGSIRWLREEINFITDEFNKPLIIEGAVQDITETKNQIEFIEEQNKRLKEIAWMQSHIIRAPLARIMGLIDLLKDESIEKDEAKEFLDAIFDSVLELDKVIHDITEKTKIIEHNETRNSIN